MIDHMNQTCVVLGLNISSKIGNIVPFIVCVFALTTLL